MDGKRYTMLITVERKLEYQYSFQTKQTLEQGKLNQRQRGNLHNNKEEINQKSIVVSNV